MAKSISSGLDGEIILMYSWQGKKKDDYVLKNINLLLNAAVNKINEMACKHSPLLFTKIL